MISEESCDTEDWNNEKKFFCVYNLQISHNAEKKCTAMKGWQNCAWKHCSVTKEYTALYGYTGI